MVAAPVKSRPSGNGVASIASDGDGSSADRKTIAVFDFDGTLTRYDTYLRFLILALLMKPTRLPRCWPLPLDTARFALKLQQNTWLKQRYLKSVLGGADRKALAPITEALYRGLTKNGLRPEGMAELARHRAAGHRTVLLSAGLDFYLETISPRLGFDSYICTRAEWDENGRLSGRLAGENCLGPEKVRQLGALIGDSRESWHVVVYGDSASDLPIMEQADEAFVVNPSKSLARRAESVNARALSW